MESRVNVIVNITDANDLAPSFSTLPAPLTLAEDMAVVTTVASVRATDGDSGTNGEVCIQSCWSRSDVCAVLIDAGRGSHNCL